MSDFPITPELARALAMRIRDATTAANEPKVPVSLAAEFRRDAGRYLGVRRTRELRLPASLESSCDDGARALMRLTADTPGSKVTERAVA